jgi:hypothetical protein
MLVKVEDGFYLNTQHIIAVRLTRLPLSNDFEVTIEFTPNNHAKQGEFKRRFNSQMETEAFLKELNHNIR